ncbi:unnamed protein product [Cuscuta europaea]|uniref:Uncharacterized protein n=1 Tax=Cuscuta europaea TaxID=41803 RepID=A0A9P1EFZ5_CUSEU|nr:unnamed protein product [Cuscuta europaea]
MADAADHISATQPEQKKPKLDHSQKTENMDCVGRNKEAGAESMATSGGARRSGSSALDSRPSHADLEGEEVVELCKLALSDYLKKHAGESYEFVRAESGTRWFTYLACFKLKFYAKNLKASGNLHIFKATAHIYPYKSPEERQNVWECVKLKDEGEDIALKGTGSLRTGEISTISEICVDIHNEKEAVKVVKLSKLALSYYQNHHPGEAYEFKKVSKAKYRVRHGVEYNIVFQAKNMGTKERTTFQASVSDYVPASQVDSCELLLE